MKFLTQAHPRRTNGLGVNLSIAVVLFASYGADAAAQST